MNSRRKDGGTSAASAQEPGRAPTPAELLRAAEYRASIGEHERAADYRAQAAKLQATGRRGGEIETLVRRTAASLVGARSGT